MNEKIKIWLKKEKIFFIDNFEVYKRSWLRCGGVINLYIQPDSCKQAYKILKFFKDENIDFYVLGNLSNTLVRDGLILTPIINLKKIQFISRLKTKDSSVLIKCSAGTPIFKLATYVSYNLSITGTEGLIGIPGSIGGAVYMNASSYDSCISDYLHAVIFFDIKNKKIVLKKRDDLLFGWRNSPFQKNNNIILICYFRFNQVCFDNIEIINNKIKKIREHRSFFQENTYPNLGSLYATKDLYYDLGQLSFFLKILFNMNFYTTKVLRKFFKKNSIIIFRKFLVFLYSKYFKIKKSDNFLFSDKTINCLINKNGSKNSSEAILLIKKIDKIINGKINKEIVILDKIL